MNLKGKLVAVLAAGSLLAVLAPATVLAAGPDISGTSATTFEMESGTTVITPAAFVFAASFPGQTTTATGSEDLSWYSNEAKDICAVASDMVQAAATSPAQSAGTISAADILLVGGTAMAASQFVVATGGGDFNYAMTLHLFVRSNPATTHSGNGYAGTLTFTVAATGAC